MAETTTLKVDGVTNVTTPSVVDEKDSATETMDGGAIDEKPEDLTRFGKFCQRHGINSNLIMLKITLFVMYGGEYKQLHSIEFFHIIFFLFNHMSGWSLFLILKYKALYTRFT